MFCTEILLAKVAQAFSEFPLSVLRPIASEKGIFGGCFAEDEALRYDKSDNIKIEMRSDGERKCVCCEPLVNPV